MPEAFTDENPKVYSRISIVVFSIFLSTIFGGIMFIQNLSAIDKKQPRSSVILFCIVWQILAGKLMRQLTDNVLISMLLVNLIGGLILAKPFWDHHFNDVDYEATRNAWTPIAIVIILYGGLVGLHFLS